MKKISFYPSSKDVSLVVPPPKPAKFYIQQWYKDIKMFNNTGKPVYKDGIIKNLSIKSCMPFYDAMISGYIQETWCDINITPGENGDVHYNFSGFPPIMRHRDEPSLNTIDEFYNIEFVWLTPWIPKVSKGYSLLFTSPQNFILPFKTTSGIIDSDVFYHVVNGATPFYIKKDFSGTIPAGTPMYQMIPIKRDNWKSYVEEWNEDLTTARTGVRMKKFIGLYRNYFHVKKSYT